MLDNCMWTTLLSISPPLPNPSLPSSTKNEYRAHTHAAVPSPWNARRHLRPSPHAMHMLTLSALCALLLCLLTHPSYNLRVVECRLAACLLSLALGAPAAEARGVVTLREVEGRIADK